MFFSFFVNSSGAIYFKDPASIFETSRLVAIPAIPKSTIFNFSPDLSANKIFSNLRSL